MCFKNLKLNLADYSCSGSSKCGLLIGAPAHDLPVRLRRRLWHRAQVPLRQGQGGREEGGEEEQEEGAGAAERGEKDSHTARPLGGHVRQAKEGLDNDDASSSDLHPPAHDVSRARQGALPYAELA